MDIETKNRIIGELAVRYKTLLDPDDPAFILVEMNAMALESATADSTRELREAAQQLAQVAKERSASAAAAEIAAATAQDLAAQAGRFEASAGGVQKQLDVLRDQSAGIAQVITAARHDYAHSAHALEESVARAKAAIDNPDIKAVAGYEKTILGILGIGILAVASVGGFLAGRYTATAPYQEFAQLNDVPAMMRCSNGIPETRPDGSRICSLALGIDPTRRVIAWKIP